MKLAVLGGSFNPVHKGHVALASSVITLLHYDHILLVPALMSPHKSGFDYIASEHRVNMLNLAFRDCEWAEISLCEIDRAGPSYTVDTIESIYNSYSFDGKPGLIVGDDWVDGFSSWKNVDRIVNETELIVARREGRTEDFPYPSTSLANPVVTVSSSKIRRSIKDGLEIESYVPSPVADYIKRNGLYTV
jgi:nicotinate-nucleotide adenylyltransferase